ncbi:glycosyltransferase family 2 protein [Tabrizicola oligotrophica]|uniref:Glycosyltransferase family 2 protein n=1 Tax=Tabrizicola oligotrophica TaxID=2710650 RepID=A0A6M0QTU0_9RHOB|nr:glycosyltransferase family 2 protein [Tabrizicola oligotrophica]NEY90411.1 glycosyltransferase family 2 protein [Tabrizicola oligotrophica]
MPGHVLISSLKNEGPFILEWVAHHRVLGFDAIHVASNDCTDGSEVLLEALARAGIISHTPNLLHPGDIPQHAGYEKIRAAHPIDRADWLMMLDTDEFLNIHVGGHRVQDLTALASGADIVSLSARSFSDLPQTAWQPGPVTRAFPMAHARHHRASQSVKTLTHDPARFGGIHNHHMIGFRGSAPLRVFSAQTGETQEIAKGTPLGDRLRHIPKEAVGYKLAQYNHYAIKTLDSYLLRRDRGRGAAAGKAGAANDRHTFDYFTRRAGRGTPEPSIQRYFAETDRLIAELLADPAIAAAHRACEAAHAAAIAAIRAAPDWT